MLQILDTIWTSHEVRMAKNLCRATYRASNQRMKTPFTQKLSFGAELTEEDRAALNGLLQHVRNYKARGDILSEGDAQKSIYVVVKGWACRFKLLENGKQQIISILLPGDLSEPFGVIPDFVENSLCALTPVTLARVPFSEIKAVSAGKRIAEALWWDLLFTTALERQHVVSLGRRTALERLAHLLCELHIRLGLVGQVKDQGFELGVTQTDIADVLGLSTVHVNRSLQDLRAARLISLDGRHLKILDIAGLREEGTFDPAYMHLDDDVLRSIDGLTL